MNKLKSPAPGRVQGLENQCQPDAQANSSKATALQFSSDADARNARRTAQLKAMTELAQPYYGTPDGKAFHIVLALYWRFAQWAKDWSREECGPFPFYFAAEEIAIVARMSDGDPGPTEDILRQLIAAVKAGAECLPAEIGEAIKQQFNIGRGMPGHG